MPQLTVYDSVLIPREIELPEACPSCHASFTTGSNLIEWDRAEVQFHGNLANSTYDVQCEADRGDTFHPIGYYCAACCHCLADGRNTILPSDSVP